MCVKHKGNVLAAACEFVNDNSFIKGGEQKVNNSYIIV